MTNEHPPGTDYVSIPVSAAKRIADEFDKSIVVILAYDRAHEMTHTTTYGRDPQDKLDAAAAGEYLTECAGADLSKRQMYEDFLDHAGSLDFLKAVADAQRGLIAELKKTPCPKADFPNDTCDFWAERYGQERCSRCAAIAKAEGKS